MGDKSESIQIETHEDASGLVEVDEVPKSKSTGAATGEDF